MYTAQSCRGLTKRRKCMQQLPKCAGLRLVTPHHKRTALAPLHTPDYLFSTSNKCIARYARTTKAPAKTPSPMQSFHNAMTSNPNELKMADPGTSMSIPYLWSTSDRYLTSFTISPSNA